MYFDELMAWRAEYEDAQLEKLASKPKLVIHAVMYDTLKLDPVEDEVTCEIDCHEGHPPKMSVFDLPPPIYPPRIVILTFELESAVTGHVIFSGNTKPFQAGFVGLKIKGQTYNKSAENPIWRLVPCHPERQSV